MQISMVVAVTCILVTSIATVVSQVTELVVGDTSTSGGAVEGVRGAGGLRIANCTRHKLHIVDCKTSFISLCRLSYKLNLEQEKI